MDLENFSLYSSGLKPIDNSFSFKKWAKIAGSGLAGLAAAVTLGWGVQSCGSSEEVYRGKTTTCKISMEVFSEYERNTRKDLTAECGQFSLTYIDSDMDSKLDTIVWEEDGLGPLTIHKDSTDPFERTLFKSADVSYQAFLATVDKDLNKKMEKLPSILPVKEDD